MEERRQYTRYPIKTPAEVITIKGNIPAVVTEISTKGPKLQGISEFLPKSFEIPASPTINLRKLH